MNRAIKLFSVCVFVFSGLVACDSDNNQTLNSDTVTSDATGVQTNTGQGTDEQQVENFAGTAAQSEIDGSWLRNCYTEFPEDPIEYVQESIVVQGSSYERTINYYQDSDCSVPSAISFIRIRSTDFEITGETFETTLGVASIFNVGSWMLDVDETTLTEEDVALFDPAIGIYDLYLLATDSRLYVGSRSPTFGGDKPLDLSRYFTKQ